MNAYRFVTFIYQEGIFINTLLLLELNYNSIYIRCDILYLFSNYYMNEGEIDTQLFLGDNVRDVYSVSFTVVLCLGRIFYVEWNSFVMSYEILYIE